MVPYTILFRVVESPLIILSVTHEISRDFTRFCGHEMLSLKCQKSMIPLMNLFKMYENFIALLCTFSSLAHACPNKKPLDSILPFSTVSRLRSPVIHIVPALFYTNQFLTELCCPVIELLRVLLTQPYGTSRIHLR